MRIVRLAGNAVLWVIAVVGVLSMLVFGATRLGYLKPLVVISGSMQPGIMTGDLLVDTPHPTSELKVGDVASLPSAMSGKLISHRVVKVVAHDGYYDVNLKGDANQSQDGETYVVGDTVWQPALQVPHAGYVVSKLNERGVALPLGVALLALIGIALVPGDGGRSRASRTQNDTAAEASSAAAVALDGSVPADAAAATAVPDADVAPVFPDRIADLSGALRR